MRTLFVFLVAGALLVNGCSSIKKKKTPEELTKGGATTVQPTPAPPPSNTTGQHEQIKGLQPFPAGAVDKIYFDFDKSNIRKDQMAAMEKDLAYFKANPDAKVYLEGHTDERGTVEYNFALGMRRAQAVQHYLVQNGIAPARIQIASKGEEQPADAGHNEAAWAKNRRVEFMRWF